MTDKMWNRLFKTIVLMLSGLCVLCTFVYFMIFVEELNIRQLQRNNLELVHQQEQEKLEYFQLLNDIYGQK